MMPWARLSSAWDRVRTSYWFLPTTLSLVAAGTSAALLQVDYAVSDTIRVDAWWLYGGDANGARALMATIIGSTMTVVSVVFSITIVSLTLASAHFGSRLLRMFIRDTGNQLVLGVFIATFVYSLLVMRSVRGTDEVQFVPYVSVTLAVVLVLVCIGLLIYFIHHISVSIQADQVVASVSREVNDAIRRLYPDRLDAGADAMKAGEPARPTPAIAVGEPAIVRAGSEGYMQAIDIDQLVNLACTHDLQVALPLRAGAFVTDTTPLVLAWPRDHVSGEVAAAMTRSVVIGRHRTLTQDVEHGISQLVEVAVRALSPGINDPLTALSCLDRLGAILARLARTRLPSPFHRDGGGRVRLVTDVPSFAGFADTALVLIRENAGSSPAVLLRMLDLIAGVAPEARTPSQRAVLREHARLVRERGMHRFDEEHNLAQLARRYRQALEALDAAGSASHAAVPRGAYRTTP